jgi:hypothetical protein
MKSWKIGAAVMALSLCAAASAQAGAILQDQSFWYAFEFDAQGAFAIAAPPSWTGGNVVAADDPAWTFNVAGGNVAFQVTDAWLKGDIFDVYDFGSFVGETSNVPQSNVGTTSNPDVAFADPTYSSASFAMGAGNHSITIKAAVNPYQPPGEAYFRVKSVDSVTPEPGAMPLMALGLIGLAVVARRRA